VSRCNGSARARGFRASLEKAAMMCLVAVAAWAPLTNVFAQVTDYVQRNNEQINQICIQVGCDRPSSAGPGQAPGIWGALAMSPSTLVSGSTWGYQDKQTAENSALKECSLAMNAMRDCKIVGSFANACAAFATSVKEHAWGYSGTYDSFGQAADAAMNRCRNGGGHACTITTIFCSPSRGTPKLQYWGAIAMSPGTLYSGKTWNYGSRQDAAAAAMEACASKGARDCKVVAAVANVCVAYAASLPENVYGVSGAVRSIKLASSDALAQCQRAGGRSCVVDESLCADGVRR
jgi:hypothetical protein